MVLSFKKFQVNFSFGDKSLNEAEKNDNNRYKKIDKKIILDLGPPAKSLRK